MTDFSSLAISLDNISKSINSIKSSIVSGYGIRVAHFNCLICIDQSVEGLTHTEITRNCGIDKAFASRVSADLIKGEFIQVNKKFDDGRKYRIKYILTEKGTQVIKEARAAIDKLFSELGEKISEYEIKCFFRVVRAVDEVLNK